MGSDIVVRHAAPRRGSYVLDLIVVLRHGSDVVGVAALDGALGLDCCLLLLVRRFGFLE